MDTLRTFIAIEIPADLRAKISEHINRLRRECPDVRASWSREDNLHLTLKFLGNVPIDRLPAISSAVEQAARHIRPFDLIVKDCGSFPPHGQPKVLWIGVSPSPLIVLYSEIEKECASAGFERDARAFHPHLTIARLRKPAGSRRLAEAHEALGFPPQSFIVSDIVVFKSDFLLEGSKHIALSRHQLASKTK
ncbi:MAG: RNA 2',3'-cyclic phosphodiesterase [Acidobacteria bacterium]|nr:MAG: RNA 2',3'-cyclic phosphodiesterase [Acidobacteriota bacterium]